MSVQFVLLTCKLDMRIQLKQPTLMHKYTNAYVNNNNNNNNNYYYYYYYYLYVKIHKTVKQVEE